MGGADRGPTHLIFPALQRNNTQRRPSFPCAPPQNKVEGANLGKDSLSQPHPIKTGQRGTPGCGKGRGREETGGSEQASWKSGHGS